MIAPVSANGEVCFYVYGTAHLLADVSGYFPAGTANRPPVFPNGPCDPSPQPVVELVDVQRPTT